MIKFRWVGFNKHFKEMWIDENLTTERILNGDFKAFFTLENRKQNGNCKFISEDLHTLSKDIKGKDVYVNDYDSDGNCVTFCEKCKSFQFAAIDIESKDVCIDCHSCDGNFMFEDHIYDFEILGNLNCL